MLDRSLSGGDVVLVTIVLAISLAALGFAFYLVRAVLAADQGTTTMREISRAVQEGAGAYLRRQFRTLGVFAVIVFLLLLCCRSPRAASAQRWAGRCSSWWAPCSRRWSASSA